ncbi:MAG TPA: S-methyl-5-thioribose-1-phosphate isomerase, partial [Pirellulales bacterium]|nr:S-methyl-5-thioribose-1-phosphate isomerase [Pirellulales bacterium]
MNTTSVEWVGGVEGHLRLIDQTRLPTELVYLECRDIETVFEAIRSLRVRGAPAIGIAAAYGVCLGVRGAEDEHPAPSQEALTQRLEKAIDYLATSRPTAVNLFWALERMRGAGRQWADRQLSDQQTPQGLVERLLEEARAIHEEDRAMCHAIGRYGAA